MCIRDRPTDASTGGMTDTESIREDTVLNNDSVASAVDSERVTGDATSDRNEMCIRDSHRIWLRNKSQRAKGTN